MKVKIKHVDFKTYVMAKVFITSDGISLEYKYEGMSYSRILELDEAVKMGIVECTHPNVNPIIGFENGQIGEICTVCNKEMMFRDIYNIPIHNSAFKPIKTD